MEYLHIHETIKYLNVLKTLAGSLLKMNIHKTHPKQKTKPRKKFKDGVFRKLFLNVELVSQHERHYHQLHHQYRHRQQIRLILTNHQHHHHHQRHNHQHHHPHQHCKHHHHHQHHRPTTSSTTTTTSTAPPPVAPPSASPPPPATPPPPPPHNQSMLDEIENKTANSWALGGINSRFNRVFLVRGASLNDRHSNDLKRRQNIGWFCLTYHGHRSPTLEGLERPVQRGAVYSIKARRIFWSVRCCTFVMLGLRAVPLDEQFIETRTRSIRQILDSPGQ
ncbi:unnamed protein product, partial [Nesidiocoris tenuis]